MASTTTVGQLSRERNLIASVRPETTSSAYLRTQGSSLVLGNEQVELAIDARTGFFLDLTNKQTGIHHKVTGTGTWPFGLRLGDAVEPDLLRIDIGASPLHPQNMTYSEPTPSARPNAKSVTLHYEDLLTTGGASTRVRMTVQVTLRHDADYYLIRAKVENGGKHCITNLFSGTGEFVADEAREKEALAVPGWSCGTIWENPWAFYQERESFGYPMFGSQGGLMAAWIDLYGENGGIGTGYLNRQGLTMYFNVQRGRKGLNVNWQLFNLLHQKAIEKWTNVGGIYPLKPGEQFETDDWILAPHAGDWHRMADIYRLEYEAAFSGDYLTWSETHDIAKEVDLCTSYTIQDIRDQFPGEPIHNKFIDTPPKIKNVLQATGVDPENLLIVILGHSIHFCLYMPDFMPCSPEGGGDEACRKMISDIRTMGVKAILLYAHLFYDHPRANDYVAAADTGYDHQNVLWKEIGNVGCMDCDEWIQLWRTKYIPGYDKLGASGAFLDQGPTQYLVCTKSGHRHGTDSIGVLGGHVRGELALLKEWQLAYTKKPLFWTESGSDLQTRTVDIWSCPHTMDYAVGGTSKHEIVRYTFPYRLIVDDPPKNARDINDTLVNGFILGSWWDDVTSLAKTLRDDSLVSTLRQYLKIRRSLRTERAPGFPNGFRDRVGLEVTDPRLVARAYRDERGITVLYYASEAVTASINVRKEDLGFAGSELETVRVDLREHEAGYKIFAA